MHVKLFIQKLFTTTVYLILNCELKILWTILMLLRDNNLHKIRKYIPDTTCIAFRLLFFFYLRENGNKRILVLRDDFETERKQKDTE